MNQDVIEVSDIEEEQEDTEVEVEVCELQDADNLVDEYGRILVNKTRDSENEQEIFLSPQISRVIKPHQVEHYILMLLLVLFFFIKCFC